MNLVGKIDGTRNCLLEETSHNEVMSEKHKKVCKTLSYFEHFLVFVFAVSGCVLISAFASLVGVPAGIDSSAVGLKVCVITAEIRKKGKGMIRQCLLAKTKLNTIEVLI